MLIFVISAVAVIIIYTGRCSVVAADDLSAEVDEDFVDIRSPSCGGLIVWSISPALGHTKRFLSRDCAVFFEIRLVSYDDNGHIVVVLDADDLLAELTQLRETALGSDGEYKEESLTCLHIELSHGSELLSPGRI